ncbi:MAG: lectin like domain-containing protein, partial [Clostridiales bacterium]|nr:lectin like domain-containing protein [Clostridiales bacterium]
MLGYLPGKLSSGSYEDAGNALYTFTGSADSGWVISNTTSEGTTVYLNVDNSEDAYPNAAVSDALILTWNDTYFTITNGDSHNLCFADGTAPSFSEGTYGAVSDDDSVKFYLYKPVESGETGSTEIPGYVRVAGVDGITSGQQYLMVAYSSTNSAYYAIYPSVSTSSTSDHMMRLYTDGLYQLTINGIAAGTADIEVDGTVYRITVTDHACSDYPNTGITAASAGNSYPGTYDLRDGDTNGFGESLVTSVKDQSPWSTIWGFSAISAAESSIIADFADYNVNNLDLAELQLAWFANTALPEDSEDYPSQGGEGTHWLVDTGDGTLVEAGEAIGAYRLNSGAATTLATSVLARGTGPLLEDYAKYGGGVADFWINTTTGEEHWSWSYEGDWSLDEEVRYWHSFVLKNTNILPDSTNNNQEGVQAIKSELMKGRAATAAYCADTSEPGTDTSTYINTDTWAHYTYEAKSATHQICIVGWDDTYSRYMFEPKLTTEDGALDPQYFVDGVIAKGLNAEGQAMANASNRIPETDGAWIVKNSWGSSDSESPDYYDWGDSGYFYLSYYDLSISMVETFEFDVDAGEIEIKVNAGETETKETILDQYDLMTTSAYNAIDAAKLGADELAMANVFTATEDQMIRTVGVTTASGNTTVEVQIYLLNENAEDPTDGTPLLNSPATATFDYGGYHCIDLREYGVENTNLVVAKGQKYSVVATLTASGSSYVTAGISNSISAPVKSDEGIYYYSEGVINEGESYVGVRSAGNMSYEWKDWVAMAEQAEASDPATEYDNLPVKVYSDPIDSAVIAVSGNTTDCILGDTVQITVDNTVKVEVSVDNGASYADITDSYAGGYTVTENGTYLFRATNRLGTTALASITYTNIDKEEPVIGGIQEGLTYCEAVTFTVDDDNIDYVTVNGVAVTDYTLAADGSTYTVAAVDKAGNSATCTVTVRKGHNYEVTGTVAATYAEQGYTVYTCSVCGDSYRGDYTDVLTISEVDGIGTRMMIYDLTTVPEGLKGIYSSVEELINDLIRRVTVSEGYTKENVTVYDVVLQYLSADDTWVNATVDNFPTDGITITLPYPEGTDSSYEFVVLHMFTETSSRLGITAGETETPAITKTEEGLVVTVTGMSPVAIAWKAVTTSATETETTDISAASTVSSQTGDNSPVALWLALLSVSGAGVIGAVAYNRKR